MRKDFSGSSRFKRRDKSNKMDMEVQLNLPKSYSEKSDEEIRALLQSGREADYAINHL
jgi:hypothetical protein